jgi:hypothetical protein
MIDLGFCCLGSRRLSFHQKSVSVFVFKKNAFSKLFAKTKTKKTTKTVDVSKYFFCFQFSVLTNNSKRWIYMVCYAITYKAEVP